MAFELKLKLSLGAKGRNWIKRALTASGGVRLASRLARRGIAILMYHSVLDKPEDHANTIGNITHSTTAFRWQMEHLARRYSPVTVQDVLEFLTCRKSMPEKPVAVTFDDGYANNYEIAGPILDRLGIRATFYLTVKCIETGQPPWVCRLRHAFATTKKNRWAPAEGHVFSLRGSGERESAFLAAADLLARKSGDGQSEAVAAIEHELDVEPFSPASRLIMTWDQAKKLSCAGHVLGSHTLTHPNMAYVGDDDLIRELTESKRTLDAALGAPVVHFAYPGPALSPIWTDRTLARSREAGYSTAVTTTSGLVREGDDPLCLRRLGARRDNEEFVWSLENTLLGRSM